MPKIMWPEGEPENAICPVGRMAVFGRLAYSVAWALRGKRTLSSKIETGHNVRKPARLSRALDRELAHTARLEMRDWYKIPEGAFEYMDPDLAAGINAIAKMEA